MPLPVYPQLQLQPFDGRRKFGPQMICGAVGCLAGSADQRMVGGHLAFHSGGAELRFDQPLFQLLQGRLRGCQSGRHGQQSLRIALCRLQYVQKLLIGLDGCLHAAQLGGDLRQRAPQSAVAVTGVSERPNFGQIGAQLLFDFRQPGGGRLQIGAGQLGGLDQLVDHALRPDVAQMLVTLLKPLAYRPAQGQCPRSVAVLHFQVEHFGLAELCPFGRNQTHPLAKRIDVFRIRKGAERFAIPAGSADLFQCIGQDCTAAEQFQQRFLGCFHVFDLAELAQRRVLAYRFAADDQRLAGRPGIGFDDCIAGHGNSHNHRRYQPPFAVVVEQPEAVDCTEAFFGSGCFSVHGLLSQIAGSVCCSNWFARTCLQSTCQARSARAQTPPREPKARILLVLRASPADICRNLDSRLQVACPNRLLTEVNDVVVRPRLRALAGPPRFHFYRTTEPFAFSGM